MKRLLALVTIFALTAAPLATRIEAAPAAAGTGLAVPVSGSVAGGTLDNASFRITRFVSSGSKIFAQGVLTGSLTNTATGVTASIVRTVSMEVTSISGQPPATVAAAAAAPITTQAVCDILNLVLGPLHLDLLGLVVDLNQVVLNITAESGPGNLLGNLLCAITGLLDGTGTNATAIVDLLNRILGAIGL